ncbi:hypothetical protein QYF36_009493 [Acer negundo]|nr:hypothetical protein QYF36_009493 [Acer negundo]
MANPSIPAVSIGASLDMEKVDDSQSNNVYKPAISVEVNKQVSDWLIRTKIHEWAEHIQPSRCTEDSKLKKKGDELKAEAKARGLLAGSPLIPFHRN